MSSLSNLLVNLWRLIGNARSRLFRRPPGFVWIELSGALPEFDAPAGFFRRRINRGPSPVTLQTLRERLERISSDGRVRGVVLRVRDVDAGWAALEEARGELLAFREGGGRLVAYLADPVDTRSYYLASAAEEVLVAPLVTVGVTGVRASVTFFKDALDRLGVGAEVVAVSPYKSAGEPYTRNDFSREAREQAQRLLDGRYEELLRAIREARGLTDAEARTAIDNAPFGPDEAATAGLVDGVLYEDALPGRLSAGGEKPRIAEWAAAKRSLKAPYRRRGPRQVGLVQVKGAITRGRSRRLPVPVPFLGGERAGSESVVAALRGAERNRRVGAVLLHVESPGGDALASDLIWREVARITAKKPVVVLMGNVAASGGYYVSAPAAHIVARRSTVTGSIGVITIRPAADRLYESVGVNPVSLQRGERAGLMDLSRPPTEDELRVLGQQIGRVYDEFKGRVSRGRNLPDLEAIAGGRVWSGAEALDLGLVDGVGGFREAFQKARELGGAGEGGPADVLLKIPVPRVGRPAPGEPAEVVGEILEGARREFLGVAGRVWAMGPYGISDD
ncbi:MAG: SppA [uncultured Rubrobacteraceae bacterium]|uniref:SppA n=1 Tax=uncultured Rubrobacteraceae bacterium TaxID=349277 RepID=A0A6J4PPZ7_9ACTN|nr:MAG: SppA [uncultured Rubrobacteraceae bacterium]